MQSEIRVYSGLEGVVLSWTCDLLFRAGNDVYIMFRWMHFNDHAFTEPSESSHGDFL